MARRDPLNRAHFRTAPDLGDVQLLHAEFQTHRFERHVHDELVIAVTERGAGRFLSRGRRDVASAREVAVFNPGEPHEGGVFDTTCGWCYRAIYLGPRVLRHLAETVVGTDDVVPHVQRNIVSDMHLARLVFATHQALEASTTSMTRETHLIDVYARLAGRHAEMARVPETMAPARTRVVRAVDVMQDRFAENLTIGELACATGLSSFHFIRMFRRGFGIPPHAYLTQIRLRHARERLAAGHRPAEAALSAGFSDQSHMTKHFKRSYGITPAQYAAAVDVARPRESSRRAQF